MRQRSVIGVLVLTGTMLLPFQNCGGGMQTRSTGYNLRQQCPGVPILSQGKAQSLRCDDYNEYLCERRVFSPDSENLSHLLKECLPGDSICVDVDVRTFNTAAARASSSPAAFEPGGEYNREDVRCMHKVREFGVMPLEVQADSIEQALAGVIALCEQVRDGQ